MSKIGTHRQAIEYMLKLHDDPSQCWLFLKDWELGDLQAWADFTGWLDQQPEQEIDAQIVAMLSRDCARMRSAGTALAEAALYTVREYDGVHRLSLAVAAWAKAIADEGDRGSRATEANG